MFEVIEKLLRENEDISVVGKVSKEVIIQAEKELNLEIPDQLKAFYSNYGCLTYQSHEIYGLGTDGYLNVVKGTQKEREISNLPNQYILINNIGVDGLLIVSNVSGEIFEWMANGYTKKIHENFSDYLLEILK